MSASEIQVISLDKDDRKLSLIEYLKSTDTFSEYNFEGSVLNTLVDLLILDDTYTSIIANMLANESFIDSGQLRGNVVSHSQRLSYVPRSYTATRLVGDIYVRPSDITGLTTADTITMEQGTSFLSSVSNTSYTFTNLDTYVLRYNIEE